MRPSLEDLADTDAFVGRHIGPTANDQAAMLAELGLTSLDELIDRVVPTSLRIAEALDLPEPRTEHDVVAELRDIAARNRRLTSLIGQGYYGTFTPAVIQRNVLENPAWYTAYTPYQPEISQGRLEALLNFQTMVADLTGMDLSNASLLDEATAAAEAMAMSRRISRQPAGRFFVDADTHPQTLAVLATRAEPTGIELVVSADPADAAGCFGALLSYPGSSGAVRDLSPVIAELRAGGTAVTVATDLLACVLLTPPGRLGADIVIGSAQRFGVPMGFGGPHAAFMAVRDAHTRSLPGRLVGVSTDAAGRPALRLALQTREQHIRRERATSNICTAQVLLANIAGFYAMYHGPVGLARIAERTHRLASMAAAGLAAGGHAPVNATWFDTLTIPVADAAAVHEAAEALDLNLRRIDDHTVGLSFDETSTVEVVEKVWHVFGVTTYTSWFADAASGIPDGLRRTGAILDHAVFRDHHSEHAMLRYLRRLADRDLALDRTMIPLGSCTMKLNATSEMLAITWPEFADLHPYVPANQAAGYTALAADLQAALLVCTGYDAISLQPNAGSQGEFAGLLAIRAHHRANGQRQRDVCLIPSSAHGTNAASAVMAGMRVVVVACDDDGNVDVDDLHARIDEHRRQLAAIMVTYPSTHGVFEPAIEQICAAVHAAGGQVYVDGANLNALVGLAKPGAFGADVSHLNLHKTFCIPHGGGGPGVGPVAVRAHLAPYLPGHPLEPVADGGVGAVAAAPHGSASILPISWAYMSMMGGSGLAAATKAAILAANYMAHRLDPHFPVLYRGEHGYVGHECIIDLRPLTKRTGVTVDDIAKRLMDFGFHAPTVSFPVAGTLMIEPTESEPLAEIDRFCAAMVAIRAEVAAVERGEMAMDDSPLRHAPHTVEDLVGDRWDRRYPRSLGAYPDGDTNRDRYFTPVSRIDAAYGDRNLVCDCGPIEAYAATVRSHG